MKWIVIGVLCAAAMACTDEQNLGNTYTLRSARWTISLATLDQSPGNVIAESVALDPADDVIVDGSFAGTVDFGGGPVTSPPGNPQFWLGKRSGVDGSYVWNLFAGPATVGNFEVSDFRVDTGGNTIVAGSVYGTEPFGDQMIVANGQAFFVAKISPDGHVLWARVIGEKLNNANGTGLALGADGRIYFSAEFQGSITFPNGVITGPTEDSYLLAALDADGTMRWGKSLPVLGHIAIANDDSVILVGAPDRSITFGGVSIDLTKDPARFAAKITPDGDIAWVHTFGQVGVPYEHVLLAVDDHDRIATTSIVGTAGAMGGTNDVGLDANGDPLWSASPASGHVDENVIATNGHAILTAGTMYDWTVDLGNGPQVGSMYIAARDDEGNLVDTKVFGDPGRSGAGFLDIAMSSDGAVAFTAATPDSINFGSGPVQGTIIGLFAPSP
jgi:hypothetical protein